MADLPIGDVLGDTVQRFMASPGDFLILAFLATAAPLVLNALILYPVDPGLVARFQGTGGTGTAFSVANVLLQDSLGTVGTGAQLSPVELILGGGVTVVVGTVLGALFVGALVARALDEPEEGGPVEALETGIDHLLPLVLAGFAIAAISWLVLLPGLGLIWLGGTASDVAAVMSLLGIALLLVGFVVLIYVLVALFVWRVVIIEEGADAIEALKRSWELTEDNRLAVFLVGLVIGIVTGIAALVIQVPFILGATGSPFPQGPTATFSVLRAVGTVVAGTVTGAFIPIASVRIYAHLADRPAPDRDDEAPGPSPPEGYVPVEPGS